MRGNSNQAAVAKEKAEASKAEVEKKAATIKKGITIAEIFIDAFKEVSKISAVAATARALAAVELANPITITLGIAHTAASAAAAAQIPFVLGTATAQAGAVAIRKFSDGKSPLYKTSSMSVKDVILFEKMNPGVVTKGTTGRADDVPALISKDETIINAKSSKIFNKELSYINSFNGYGIKFAADGYGNSSIGSSPVFDSLRGAKNLINAPEDRTVGLLERIVQQNDELINVGYTNTDINTGILQKPILSTDKITDEVTTRQNTNTTIRSRATL